MQEEQQVTEVRETTTTPTGTTTTQRSTKAARSPGAVVAARTVWLIIGLICVIIGLRFIFLALGANQGAALTDFIYGISTPFVLPFFGIFGEATYGQSIFEVSSIVAIVIYLLIGWAITALLTLARPRSELRD